MRASLRSLLCLIVIVGALGPCLTSAAEAARWGPGVGGGAGAPALHAELEMSARTALSMALGLNRVYSGVYVQLGGKFFLKEDGVGPYAHLTGTYGTGQTSHAVWQTGEVGIAIGNSWRLAEKLRIHFEVGVAVGDGVSYTSGGKVPGDTPPSTRYTIGWRLLYGN